MPARTVEEPGAKAGRGVERDRLQVRQPVRPRKRVVEGVADLVRSVIPFHEFDRERFDERALVIDEPPGCNPDRHGMYEPFLNGVGVAAGLLERLEVTASGPDSRTVHCVEPSRPNCSTP